MASPLPFGGTSSRSSAAIWPMAQGRAKQHTQQSLIMPPLIPSFVRVLMRRGATESAKMKYMAAPQAAKALSTAVKMVRTHIVTQSMP
eukprot:14006434-Heterocapsa_arctica.AAC.1